MEKVGLHSWYEILMELPAALAARFPPSRRRLLDVTRVSINDTMLEEIAAADYGCDFDEHLAALRPIRDEGKLLEPFDWNPGEVLELTRYCDPECPNPPPFAPGSTGLRGHRIRAFACAALLYRGTQHDTAADATLAQCLVSARALEPEVSEAIGCFLTWETQRIEEKPRNPYGNGWLFALGLLIVASRPTDRLPDQVLAETAAWVLAEEGLWREGDDPSDPKPAPPGLGRGLWKPLTAELVENAALVEDARVRDELKFIGTMLTDEW